MVTKVEVPLEMKPPSGVPAIQVEVDVTAFTYVWGAGVHHVSDCTVFLAP